MGFFRRLSNLGRGMWKVKRQPDPEFDAALEKELAHVVTEQEKARAKARLDQMKGTEGQTPEGNAEGDTADGNESEKPSASNPPKKTL